MGLDTTIRFASSEIPSWDAIRTLLAQLGEVVQLRMIDGLPAFPDEVPEPSWKELRLGLSAGMVTIRRGVNVLTCVIWGTNDPALQVSWNKVILACAIAGLGLVETPEGPLSPQQFAKRHKLNTL